MPHKFDVTYVVTFLFVWLSTGFRRPVKEKPCTEMMTRRISFLKTSIGAIQKTTRETQFATVAWQQANVTAVERIPKSSLFHISGNRRIILALMAMTTSAVIKYVSDKDPAKTRIFVPVDPEKPEGDKKIEIVIGPNATVFHLAPLDVFLMGYIYDNASSITGTQGASVIGITTKVNQTNIDAVKFGLVGIDNFVDDKNGNLVVLKRIKSAHAGRRYEAVPDEVLTKLGVQLVQELADEIKRISEVSSAEAKNFAGA